MIVINSSDIVGKGLHRECHTHPEDNNLCIKVAVNENIKETLREQKYYLFLKKRGISWDMLPKFYGNIETNMGPGAVFDLIRNHDGSVSKTLEHYLSSNREADRCYNGLSKAFYALKNYLLNEQITTMTIKPKNLLYQELNTDKGKDKGTLFIVDNIGNSDYIPLCNYSRWFANKKIHRKWQRFESSILNIYPDNTAFKNIISQPN